MKKLFYLFMVAMCATMFSACSDDDKDPLNDDGEGKEGVITMVIQSRYESSNSDFSVDIETFNEGKIITIDWGDGNVEEFKSIRIYGYWDSQWYEGDDWYGDIESGVHYLISNNDDYKIRHEYSDDKPYTITIKGEIKNLYCSYNELTSLDVSGCTALTELSCGDNNLTSLDVSKCTKLTYLNCGGDNLTSLNVSGCTALTDLDCVANNLTSLDVSKCTALTVLDCWSNNLTSLNVSGCTALTELSCGDNNLTSLDVSKNTALTYLECLENNLTTAALNQIFRDLPQGKKLEDYPYQSTIHIRNNPGTNTCDKSIAEKKGWEVITPR